jgi:hypothetical protein
VTNTERIRSERRKKNRKNRAWKKEEESKTLPKCYPSTFTLLLINTTSSRKNSDLTKTLQ